MMPLLTRPPQEPVPHPYHSVEVMLDPQTRARRGVNTLLQGPGSAQHIDVV